MYIVYLNDGIPGVGEYDNAYGYFIKTDNIDIGRYVGMIVNDYYVRVPIYNVKMILSERNENA